jgi:hypothetical protein
MTSGVQTFSGDERFSAHNSRVKAGGENWVLQIKYTQLRDAGEYQCQVNTEPKISSSVFLKVSGMLNSSYQFIIQLYIFFHLNFSEPQICSIRHTLKFL